MLGLFKKESSLVFLFFGLFCLLSVNCQSRREKEECLLSGQVGGLRREGEFFFSPSVTMLRNGEERLRVRVRENESRNWEGGRDRNKREQENGGEEAERGEGRKEKGQEKE